MGSGFEVKDGEVIIRINTQVYPLARIYAAAYTFMDRYFFILDAENENEVVVRIKPKDPSKSLEEIPHEFFEEILSITNYFSQLEQNKDIIQLIMRRALFSVTPQPLTKEKEQEMDKILLG